jgi:hypothetical protein
MPEVSFCDDSFNLFGKSLLQAENIIINSATIIVATNLGVYVFILFMSDLFIRFAVMV